MAYTCEMCGQVMQSEGSFGLHQITAHVAGAAPAPTAGGWAAPQPQSQGAYGQYPDPYGRYGAPRRKSNPVFVIVGAVFLAFALLVVGCVVVISVFGTKSKPSQVAIVDPSAPPTMPADFHSVVKTDDGFLVGLPASFNEVPFTADVVANSADALESSNPALASVLRSNSSKGVAGARLFAIDDGTGNNQTIQRLVVDGAGTVDEIPPGTFSDEYRGVGATSVIEERVHLPAGDALKVTAVISVGSRNVLITQHILVRDSSIWILTYTQDAGTDTSQGAAIASTFGYTR